MENTADFDMEVHNLIKALLSKHRRIVFNGNGYSKEWIEEAKRRGLPNLKSMVDAIGALKSEKAVKLFESFGVYTRAELESRSEIEFEAYTKAVAVEAKTMLDMTGKLYIPAIIKYIGALAHSSFVATLAIDFAGDPESPKTWSQCQWVSAINDGSGIPIDRTAP